LIPGGIDDGPSHQGDAAGLGVVHGVYWVTGLSTSDACAERINFELTEAPLRLDPQLRAG
jgi:hypothetical protein